MGMGRDEAAGGLLVGAGKRENEGFGDEGDELCLNAEGEAATGVDVKGENPTSALRWDERIKIISVTFHLARKSNDHDCGTERGIKAYHVPAVNTPLTAS